RHHLALARRHQGVRGRRHRSGRRAAGRAGAAGELKSTGRPLRDYRSGRNAHLIDVFNNVTTELVGSITEADLKVLMDHLEEESQDDQDYYIDQATLDVIGDGQATE